MSSFDITQPVIADDAKRYLVRTYGPSEGERKMNDGEFLPIDIKMILTMGKLRSSYNTLRCDRKRTLYTSQIEIQKRDVDQRELLKKDMLQKEITKKERLMKTRTLRVAKGPVGDPIICKAFKMSGDKCTAKATNGHEFCARHSKK